MNFNQTTEEIFSNIGKDSLRKRDPQDLTVKQTIEELEDLSYKLRAGHIPGFNPRKGQEYLRKMIVQAKSLLLDSYLKKEKI